MVSRAAGAAQGWVLIATTWLAVAAATLIAPVAPRMAEYFAADPNAEVAVQVGIGLPALFVAVFAGPFGTLADRVGRRRLLMGALLLYAAAGIAPLWLDSLPLILASRAGVGIAEAAVLATGTALIGDYFVGDQREKWFAIQGGSATIVAILFITISGALGEAGGWRLPFAVYAAPIALAALAGRVLWEPARAGVAAQGPKTPLLRRMLSICGVTLFTAFCFYVVLVQLPFLLTERGFGATWQISLGVVAATITAPLGAFVFRLMRGRSVPARLALCFSASSLGLLIISLSSDFLTTLAGAAVNGFGSGIALPTLVGWAIAGVPPRALGRASGWWNAAFFFGQFLSPPVFLALASTVGGRPSAMAVVAVALGFAAAASVLAANRRLLRPRLEVEPRI